MATIVGTATFQRQDNPIPLEKADSFGRRGRGENGSGYLIPTHTVVKRFDDVDLPRWAKLLPWLVRLFPTMLNSIVRQRFIQAFHPEVGRCCIVSCGVVALAQFEGLSRSYERRTREIIPVLEGAFLD